MPKVLKAYNTDYRIASRPGGEIVLDTGIEEGTVIVTGDLQVKGDTTTVNTTDLEIEDNIIILNKGELGEGVTEGTSGIEIDRGDFSNTRWIFDESVEWSLGGINGTGTLYAERVADSQKLPLNTPGIVSPGTLYVDTGNEVISVTGTTNYEESVFNYVNNIIAPAADGSLIIDDDHIPNAKAIADYVEYSFNNNVQSFIQQGNTIVASNDEVHTIEDILSINALGNGDAVILTKNPHGFSSGNTVNIAGINANGDPIENLNQNNLTIIEVLNQFSLRIQASITTGDITSYITDSGTISLTSFEESSVNFTVEGVRTANYYNNRTEIFDLEFRDSTITVLEENQDLNLQAPGSGTVKIKDTLELEAGPWDETSTLPPIAPQNGVKLYSTQTETSGNFQDQTLGKTGVFFVNSNQTQDELISRNRSLLYSMLF